MATWFDRNRGKRQGRIQPVDQSPADGDYVFLLGEDAPEEVAQITTGDYTEVRQIVDLSDYDFVNATQKTIGRAVSVYAVAPSWARDAAELFAFDFDTGTIRTLNLIAAGFALDSFGDISYPHETYTGARKRCRAVPVNTTVETHLMGVNTPAIATPLAALSAYTLQWWWNPSFDDIVTSWGWDFDVLRLDAVDESDGLRYGLRLEMRGLTGAGAHSWSPYLTHYAGANQQGISLASLYAQDPSPGWQQLTLTYDASVSPATDRLTLYADKVSLGHPGTAMTVSPFTPPEDGAVQYAHKNGWGQWDSVRLLSRAMNASEVETSYDQATTFGLSSATKWIQRIIIDGDIYAERILRNDERRTWTDFMVPARHLLGEHEVAFRLSLEDI
jgi:hypothetical protein